MVFAIYAPHTVALASKATVLVLAKFDYFISLDNPITIITPKRFHFFVRVVADKNPLFCH
jgi:hypothetical protein